MASDFKWCGENTDHRLKWCGENTDRKLNQEISVIVTQIIYAKDQLKTCYKNHGLLLITYDQKDFIQFFYLQLHTSIMELIKNDLQISNYDPATSPKIEEQHLRCRRFLQSIIEEKKS